MQTFTSLEGRFRVEFPCEPQEGRRDDSSMFVCEEGRHKYFVVYTDLAEEAADRARVLGMTAGGAPGFEVLWQEPVDFGHFPATMFALLDPENLVHTQIHVLVGRRLYQFGVISPFGEFDSKGFGVMAETFRVFTPKT